MNEYLTALKHIYRIGEERPDRTGVGTIGVFGYQMRFNLKQGFPAVTTKQLAWKSVIAELLWFLEGSTNERRLAEILHGPDFHKTNKKTIWTENADNQGKSLGYINNKFTKELGPIYGAQWRSWKGANNVHDQIREVITNIKEDPYSRRHIVNAWNVDNLHLMALPPCHVMFQFYVANGRLSCQLYQRSADMFLGVPFNIASYALLTHMVAQMTGLTVGDLIWTGGDCHIYKNHIEQVEEQLTRKPMPLPVLVMPKFKKLKKLLKTNVDDYKLENYNPMPPIKAPMAI
jgi:thymidylate synthase